ncbi:tyrosine-type recombinase/integrase [Thalassotalea euphylliae]|uniref:Integrase n=1 Tax=Thalassotalea euphylliae TaxID=1655234 RepID=A0A3E0UCT3_9GAMM|nr:tyrosine-type recombinase/integrase [Thalassotalea euphylliae]REL34706.1 integrase [Thalassotalea euphylliae]
MGRQRSTGNMHLPKGMIFNKKGSVYYYRTSGQKDIRLGKTFTEAFIAYEELTGAICSLITMNDVINRYLVDESPKKVLSTQKEDLRIAKKLRAAIGHFLPSQVKAKHAVQYLHHRAKEGSPVGGNREYSLWSAIMTAAFNWGIIEEQPFLKAGIKKNPEKPRDRLVTDEEVAAFLKHVPEWLNLYVQLKLATGLRQRDMLRLDNTHWNTLEGLRVGTSKTSVRINFESTQHLSDIVNDIKRLNGYTSKGATKFKWHFFTSRLNKPYTEGGFETMWRRYMNDAISSGDLKERFQERDLRAKAATQCESLVQAFELLGHKNISTTKKIYRRGYSKVTPLSPYDESGNEQNIEKK